MLWWALTLVSPSRPAEEYLPGHRGAISAAVASSPLELLVNLVVRVGAHFHTCSYVVPSTIKDEHYLD